MAIFEAIGIIVVVSIFVTGIVTIITKVWDYIEQ